MILPGITRAASQGWRQADRYAAWKAAIGRLRRDWGDTPYFDINQLVDYLHHVPVHQQREALRDLIAEHLRLSWRQGRRKRLEDYAHALGEAFQELASAATMPIDLIEDEWLARYQLPCGDMPAMEEYRRRFPSRADVLAKLGSRCLDGGRYVKLTRIGRGAIGEIWEAHDRHLHQRIAIKEPRTDPEDSRTHVAKADLHRRFAQEARTMAGLEHPGIVTLHELHDQDRNAPFYVMRLVKGQTLSERIRDYHRERPGRSKRQRRLMQRAMLESFRMACDAMAYAHRRGVLHRDLKPGNIVVGDSGETVILDWGMACLMPEPYSTNATHESQDRQQRIHDRPEDTVAGTPDYMPPEQVDGQTDGRTDVYGLGAVLYEILTGRPPHEWPGGVRPTDWRQHVREARVQPPRRVNRSVSRAIEAICLKALAPSPMRRYANPAALADDVQRHLAGQPISALNTRKASRLWERCRRALRRSSGRGLDQE